jgi:Xaa-Pro aminopeptidase
MKKILTLLFLASLTAFPIGATAETPEKPAKKMIRSTPPAPVSTDEERWGELARRRSEVAKQMADKSMLILFSTEPRLYTNDVNYVYRQENNLYYLTNLKQNDATFLMTKNGQDVKEYLFIPKRNPSQETWTGKMYSPEEVNGASGLKTIIDSTELEGFLQSVKEKKAFSSKGGVTISNDAENLYLLIPSYDFDEDAKREYSHEIEWAAGLAKAVVDQKTTEIKYEKTGNYKVHSAFQIFGSLRHIKSPYELKRLQHAIDITTEAQMRSMAMVGRAKMEYEVQAEVEYTFRRRNADFWGYPSIVGCGANATTLHYEESQGPIVSGNLLLMDVGAEYDHMTADVTRTYPVNGKFSPAQADIYRIVYNAQEAAAAATKPGATMQQLSGAANKVIQEGLVKLGLITGVGDFVPSTIKEVPDGKGGMKKTGYPQYAIWYMHGLGHWLGMNVHDVSGGPGPLKAGMTFTNEPGIYIREDALNYFPDTPENKAFLDKIRAAFEKYKNIGVRIEDDMLVTDTGAEWMTKELPRKLEDIEAFMATAPREVPYQAVNFTQRPDEVFLGGAANNILSSFNGHSGQTARRGFTRPGGETTLVGHAQAD